MEEGLCHELWYSRMIEVGRGGVIEQQYRKNRHFPRKSEKIRKIAKKLPQNSICPFNQETLNLAKNID
jgi:hypothetical protein